MISIIFSLLLKYFCNWLYLLLYIALNNKKLVNRYFIYFLINLNTLFSIFNNIFQKETIIYPFNFRKKIISRLN